MMGGAKRCDLRQRRRFPHRHSRFARGQRPERTSGAWPAPSSRLPPLRLRLVKWSRSPRCSPRHDTRPTTDVWRRRVFSATKRSHRTRRVLDAQLLRGLVRQAGSHWSEAQRRFEKALYLQPKHYEALVHLMLLAERQGDQNAAANYRRRAQQVAPGGVP